MNSKAALLPFKAIAESELAPIEWDTEGVLARQDRMVIYGDAGALKSWMLMHWALHLAAGVAWLGFPVPRPRAVLYIDEEDPERVIRRRLKRLAAGMEHSPGSDIPLMCLNRAQIRVTPNEPLAVLGLLKRQSFTPEVVIIETLARVLEGDENHNQTISQFWSRLEVFIQHGMSVVVSHHMNKQSPENPRPLRYRARGASDVGAGCDVVFAVEAAKGLTKSRIQPIKTREGTMPDAFSVQLSDQGPHDTCTKHEHSCPAILVKVSDVKPTQPKPGPPGPQVCPQ